MSTTTRDVTTCDACGKERDRRYEKALPFRLFVPRWFVLAFPHVQRDFCSWECVRSYASKQS